MKNIKMRYYDRIDVSEGIDVNKASESKECDIWHYWYFLSKGFKFQSYGCNRSNNLLTMSMSLNCIYILNIKVRDRYQNLTEEEKEKKRQYHCERNKNLSEEQMQKLVEYMRNYCLAHKP